MHTGINTIESQGIRYWNISHFSDIILHNLLDWFLMKCKYISIKNTDEGNMWDIWKLIISDIVSLKCSYKLVVHLIEMLCILRKEIENIWGILSMKIVHTLNMNQSISLGRIQKLLVQWELIIWNKIIQIIECNMEWFESL